MEPINDVYKYILFDNNGTIIATDDAKMAYLEWKLYAISYLLESCNNRNLKIAQVLLEKINRQDYFDIINLEVQYNGILKHVNMLNPIQEETGVQLVISNN
jgi:hypothetical protein